MSAPDRSSVIHETAAAFGDLLVTNTYASCTEFLQRAIAAMPPGEPWGLLSKGDGEGGYTFDNGVRVSYDVLVWPDPLTQFDVVIGAAANSSSNPADHGRIAEPTWSPIPSHEYRPGNVWVDPTSVPGPQPAPIDPGTGTPANPCRLGLSWFWLMAGFKFWPDQVTKNLDWLAAHMPIDYARALVVCGGDEFTAPDGTHSDPWIHAGSFLTWPDHGAILERVTDELFDRGIQLEWTLIGGLGQIPTASDQDAMVDHFLRHMAGREHKIALVEIMNEYTVNGGTTDLLRRLARRVRAGLPNVPLSLSAPETVMYGAGDEAIAAEVHKMYGDLPEADAITPHWNRGDHVPPNLGPYCPPLVYCNEPRGPGASAGGDVSDAEALADDYRAASAAGYAGYVFHTDWGVWDSHLPAEWVEPPRQGVCVDLADVPNINAIAPALSEVRGGSASTPPPPAVRHALQPGEVLKPGEVLVSPSGVYRCDNHATGTLALTRAATDDEDGIPVEYWNSGTAHDAPGNLLMDQADGNLVLYTATGAPVWAAHTDGNPGAMVQLQDDGNLVVYGPDGVPLWASGPAPVG